MCTAEPGHLLPQHGDDVVNDEAQTARDIDQHVKQSRLGCKQERWLAENIVVSNLEADKKNYSEIDNCCCLDLTS